MNKELQEYKNALYSEKYEYNESNPIQRISQKTDIDQYVSQYEHISDPFVLDQIKISDSKSFRRLCSKTQVFFNPENSHIRNRIIHTQEVVNKSVFLSDFLGLNTELTRAIALGHDIGHSAGGHLFEKVCAEYFKNQENEFKHEIFSAVLAVFIERNGSGLNLTKASLDGMTHHSRSSLVDNIKSRRNEANLVLYGDKIGYIFSDMNDLYRLGILNQSDLDLINKIFPVDTPYTINQRSREIQCFNALIKESAHKGYVSFEESETAQNFKQLIKLMYKYYKQLDPDLLKTTLVSVLDQLSNLNRYDPILLVAMMTDSELENLSKIIKRSKRVNLNDLNDLSIGEIINNGVLEGQTYDNLATKLHQKLSV